MKNWKTIKSKVVFNCKHFKVLEDDFMLPSGKYHRKYYLIKRNDYVVVIPRENDYLYMIKLYRYTTKSRSPEFVAGAVEKGETQLEAAKKEMKEEAGITARKIRKIGWYYAYKGCSDQKAHIFLAENLEFGEQEPEGLEKEGGIKVKKFRISEVEKMIKSGKIEDLDTIAAFNLFMLKRNKQVSLLK